MMQTRVFAPAKINLALHVTGRRADGYHLLDTLVGFASVGDWLEIGDGQPAGLTVGGPEAGLVPVGGRNSIVKVAQAFWPEAQLRLHLEKHLPVASGIGGGSADAAACFRGIEALRGLRAKDGLKRLLAIGADVPMCARSVPARVQGIGEHITAVPGLPALPLLLVNPRVEVSTPEVFKALAYKSNPDMGSLPDRWDTPGVIAWLTERRNDLEAPAKAIAPVIGTVLGALWATRGCALARMSGSGATCFGLFQSLDGAKAAAQEMAARHPDWWIAPASLEGQGLVQPQLIRDTT